MRERASNFSFRRRRTGYGAAFSGLLVFLSAVAALHSAPLERDLGEGLVYFRAPELPADLPPAAKKTTPLVLDLRFATAGDHAATALDSWLRFRATRATPAFILINAETPAALLGVFAVLKSQPGLVTIGSSSDAFTPDIVISSPPEVERRAYDALPAGTAVQALIAENTDKTRVDEASIMRERADPFFAAEPPDLTDDEESEASKAPPPPAAPVDHALQRAVHLHRALLALKRL